MGDALCTWNVVTGVRGAQLMPSALNVDNQLCLQSLDRIEALDASLLLPGHGDPLRDSPAAAVAHARQMART